MVLLTLKQKNPSKTVSGPQGVWLYVIQIAELLLPLCWQHEYAQLSGLGLAPQVVH